MIVNRRESVFRLKPNQSFKIIIQMQLQIGRKFLKILTLIVFYVFVPRNQTGFHPFGSLVHFSI